MASELDLTTVDGLPPIEVPERTALILAMTQNGKTGFLTPAQILSLTLGEDPQALKNLSNVDPEVGRLALGINAATTPFDPGPAGLPAWVDQVQKAIEQALTRGLAVGNIGYFARTIPPPGWLKANGAAIAIASYSELADVMYVGDADNATADWGYRCTDPGDPDATRDIAGEYIVLPDMRGEGIRGLDDGRGVDPGRKYGTNQLDQMQRVIGTFGTRAYAAGDNNFLFNTSGVFSAIRVGTNVGDAAAGSQTRSPHLVTLDTANSPGVRASDTTDGETRMRNAGFLACIFYGATSL